MDLRVFQPAFSDYQNSLLRVVFRETSLSARQARYARGLRGIEMIACRSRLAGQNQVSGHAISTPEVGFSKILFTNISLLARGPGAEAQERRVGCPSDSPRLLDFSFSISP